MTAKQLRAKENLFVGVHLAHFAGDPVPEENVEPNGWADKVEELTQQEAVELTADYNPGEHTVDEVSGYLKSALPEERERVLAAERADKNRAGIVG
jgi:hypothetical protein